MQPEVLGLFEVPYKTDNQEREKFSHNSYVHEDFISAKCLLNDFIKHFLTLVYSVVLLLKILGLIVISIIVFLTK